MYTKFSEVGLVWKLGSLAPCSERPGPTCKVTLCGAALVILPHPQPVLPGSWPLGFRQVLLAMVGIMSQPVLPQGAVWKPGVVERFTDEPSEPLHVALVHG